MKRFLVRRWFLIALAGVLVAGFSSSPPLKPVADGLPRNWIVAVVMFVMAFPLQAASMWKALRHPRATLLAVTLNFGLLPLVAWGLSPLLPRELSFGLLIAGAVPSTVASAAVWTRRAGGNDAISLMVTMVTNLSCFVMTPMWLMITAGAAVGAGKGQPLDPAKMMTRLLLIVALPVMAAQLLRLVAPLGRWATRHKIALGVVCQLGMLTMVFAGSVRSGNEIRKAVHAHPSPPLVASAGGPGQSPRASRAQSPPGLAACALMLGCVLTVHLAMLVTGHALGALLGVSRPDRIAVGFSGSQKTLLVGLDVAAEYVGVFGGLALLPMVAYHVSQLLVDTVIADRLRRRPLPPEEDEEPAD